MKRLLPITCAAVLAAAVPLGVLPAGSPAAAEQAVQFRKGTPVVVVGKVTSPPKGALNEKKMQVGVGPELTDYTLHFRKAQVVNRNGERIDEDGVDDGMWVRAEGRVMDDPRRIEVTRVQVIGKDEGALKQSAFFHPAFGHGYVSASQVAGMRQTFPAAPAGFVAMSAPFVIVGKVKDDTGPFERTRRVQVEAAGNTWTLHVPKETDVRDLKGEKISLHEVSEGQWVRAHGWRVGDLRLRADRLENIGRDEAFRSSPLFRAEFPMGYIDPVEGPDAFTAFTVTGTVRGISADAGSIVVRDAAGKDHLVYVDSVTLRRNGEGVGLDSLRVGDTVSVEGRSFRLR